MKWGVAVIAVAVALVTVALVISFRDDGDGSGDHRLPPAPPPAPSAQRTPWKTPAPEANPFDTEQNALWLRRQWLHSDVTDDEVAALAESLKKAGVTRVYPFLGPMNAEGVPGWRSLGVHTPWQAERAASFISTLHAKLPGVRVLPWTGGVNGRDVHFDDHVQVEAFAQQLQALVEAGADGVHINIEPVMPDDRGFVAFLSSVRAAIGPDKELSVAVVAPPNQRISVATGRYWPVSYLKQLCVVADELVIMGYDTWLDDQQTFQQVVGDWTAELAQELPKDGPEGCVWRMGVPTYDDAMPHHKLDVERVDISLRGVRDGLARASDRGGFAGVALYASWTTDAQEWAAYDALWRGRDAVTPIIPEPVR